MNNPEKEEKKCSCDNPQIESNCVVPWCRTCGLLLEQSISPHQEPVATQHDVECKGCGGVSCKNKVLKGGTVCPSCFDKMTTQEPMEWETTNCPQTVEDVYHIGSLADWKQFVSNKIKQAEERERERIVKKIKDFYSETDDINLTHLIYLINNTNQ